MQSLVNLLLLLVMLTNLTLLGTSRLALCIRLAAIQGMALGLLPLLLNEQLDIRLVAFAVISFSVKGIMFPRLLNRALRTANITSEVAPIIYYPVSIALGTAILAVSFWIGSSLVLPRSVASPLAVPLASSGMLMGLLLIVSRRNALMQVVGYLVMENGIYVLGTAVAYDQPFLVEMGVLLDVFVAVFVMGIMMFHISREFDHIDVDQLRSLRD